MNVNNREELLLAKVLIRFYCIILRGNSWVDLSEDLRIAYRGFNDPSIQSYNVGFRIRKKTNEYLF